MKTICALTLFILGNLLFSQPYTLVPEWSKNFTLGGNSDDFKGVVVNNADFSVFVNGNISTTGFSSSGLVKLSPVGDSLWAVTDSINSTSSNSQQMIYHEASGKTFYVSNGTQYYLISRNKDTRAIENIVAFPTLIHLGDYGDSLVAITHESNGKILILDANGATKRQFNLGYNTNVGTFTLRVCGTHLWIIGLQNTQTGFCAKYNLFTGQELWRVSVPRLIRPFGDVDSLGNAYLGGSRTDTLNAAVLRYKCMKLSPSGAILWDKEALVNLTDAANNNNWVNGVAVSLQKNVVALVGEAGKDSLVNDGKRAGYIRILNITNGDSVLAMKVYVNPVAGWNQIQGVTFDIYGKMYVVGKTRDVLLNPDNTGFVRKLRIDSLTGINDPSENAETFSLAQNYPNPFNPTTTIRFSIPKKSAVKITVFDILGKEIAIVAEKEYSRGVHELGFDGSNLSSGIYFYRLEADGFSETKKMILVK
jgi:hypothetical protein